MRIVVYDVTGRRVATLVDGQKSSGEKRVTWDGRNDHGAEVATGVYFYRMTTPGFSQTRKMVTARRDGTSRYESSPLIPAKNPRRREIP